MQAKRLTAISASAFKPNTKPWTQDSNKTASWHRHGGIRDAPVGSAQPRFHQARLANGDQAHSGTCFDWRSRWWWVASVWHSCLRFRVHTKSAAICIACDSRTYTFDVPSLGTPRLSDASNTRLDLPSLPFRCALCGSQAGGPCFVGCMPSFCRGDVFPCCGDESNCHPSVTDYGMPWASIWAPLLAQWQFTAQSHEV